MNTEIYQLVKHLDRTGLENLSYEEKRVELWQRAIKEWNKTHSPVTTSLEDVYQAFKFRWPQIYGGEPYNKELYLSFSYIDYLFSMNTENQICGGIWKRDGERFNEPINMAVEHITDLAALLRRVPESIEDWEMDEETIREEQDWIREYNPEEWVGDLQSQLYQHLYTLAVSQSMIGLYEESVITIGRAIQYCHWCINHFPKSKNRITDMSEYLLNTSISLAEMETLLAQNYDKLFYNNEADYCYQIAYSECMILEKNDWIRWIYGNLPKTEMSCVDQDRRCIYLNWAWNYAMFNVKCNHTKKAIEILCKAKKVANSMNKAEKGKWSAKLESITNKIKELK